MSTIWNFILSVVWGIFFLFVFLLIMVVGYAGFVVSDGIEEGLDRHKGLSDRDILLRR